MRTVLRIELIGDDFFWQQRHGQLPFQDWLRYAKRFGYNKSNSWVARITGLDNRFGFKREFLQPVKDWAGANSTGSRGIIAYWALPPGLYEINQRLSWKQVRRYFARVVDAEIQEISREELIECLTKNI